MQPVFLGKADRAMHLMGDLGDLTGRLAGADVMTKYHVYCILEAMRLEWGLLSKMESEVFVRSEIHLILAE